MSKIERRSIFYINRKYIEPNSIGKEQEYRPIIIIKKYKSNVIYLPITKNQNDESHFKISPISKSFPKSYVKLSVIQTLSTNRFRSLAKTRNQKISLEDFNRLKDNLLDFFFDKMERQ